MPGQVIPKNVLWQYAAVVKAPLHTHFKELKKDMIRVLINIVFLHKK